MKFNWKDYSSEYSDFINSWLDCEALSMTGIDEHFDSYVNAIIEDSSNFPDTVFKVIFEDHDSASIEDKWKSSVVVASGNLSIYDWDSNLTDVNLLRPATLEEVASMMTAVKNNTWEY